MPHYNQAQIDDEFENLEGEYTKPELLIQKLIITALDNKKPAKSYDLRVFILLS